VIRAIATEVAAALVIVGVLTVLFAGSMTIAIVIFEVMR
jgi:hypothetical protein